ncbi:hypothetical protein V492_02491 [Pseudogymnoascus sp. VKM F-4246]|nr:hypothetical protein V492_02491 [Pseudogymnoascus sp. VKM F-4246]
MAGAPPTGRSIFPRGPNFNLETFSDTNFIVKDFVESLSESAIPINRRSAPSSQQAFDPKPLIRAFEGALSQLATLSDDLEERETELQTAVRRAEIEHEKTLDSLGRKLDQSINSYEKLEGSLNQGGVQDNERNGQTDAAGNVAVQLGEKLEDLDKQRRRALDAQFLIQCWLEVSDTGELSSLEEVRRQGNGEGKVRCAIIARQLMRISQRLDPKSWRQANAGKKSKGITDEPEDSAGYNTKELIEKFSETLEKDLLTQFDVSYRKQNYDNMMECAKVLRDFNGGSSVVALFVNQHQFFIDRNQLITEEVVTDGDTWDRLADPDVEPPGVEPSLQSLVDEVKIVMQEESFIMKRAFPYYDVVLAKFTQRVFQQSIQQRLEMVLENADTISSLAFLRSLHASRAYINGLVEDLKSHGLTEHPDTCSAATTLVLEQQVDELFIPYLVGSSYIDRECRSLEELYSSLLFKFTIYHSRRKKTPTGFMASLAQQGTQLLATAKDAYIDRLDSSELTPTQKAMMLRVAGLKGNENKNEIEVSEEDGVLSIPNAKRMLKWLAEGVRRALELSGGTDTPKDVSVLLSMLLTSMGQVYVETALDAANDQGLAQETSKVEPDLAYFPSLRQAITITNLMNRFINTVLIRLAETNTTVRRDMENKTKEAVKRMEDKTSAIIQKTIDVVASWVTKVLAGQKKLDFRPRDADLDVGRGGTSYLEQLQTPTCAAICTFLTKTNHVAAQALDGQNFEIFNSELAICIRDLLFEHFKKFQVNATGGLMVTKDMSKYTSTLKEWRLKKDVESSLDILSDIGSIFIIGSEALKERSKNIQTGPMNKGLDKPDFRAFVSKRDDANSLGIQRVLAGL